MGMHGSAGGSGSGSGAGGSGSGAGGSGSGIGGSGSGAGGSTSSSSLFGSSGSMQDVLTEQLELEPQVLIVQTDLLEFFDPLQLPVWQEFPEQNQLFDPLLLPLL